ncbi:hypothetical protein LE181_23105 [Streptomyces sp. SCA3-4]|uniref:hypothetical protein n=1 Tax=Streptomyces sichuanensis TaxID=2871810 RepID=UPI001CE2B909|nr:hypothetical protein [Streptomyces sichuanensis]MCA6095047.1 hypothetical protein [Streptomyces sichuanensis]
MKESSKDESSTPEVRDIEIAQRQAKDLSSQILESMGLRGRTSNPGPGVAVCEERDSKYFYRIHHPWSLWGPPVSDMKSAMDRLKVNLPERGWKVTSYGANESSAAKSLELTADAPGQKFAINVTLFNKDQSGEFDGPRASKESRIMVDLVSECFRVPEGKKVDRY